MKWFLNVLFLSAVKSVYSKTIELSHHDDSKEVNKILGKVLHAAKFNELADRIAERAVKKFSEYQNSKFTENLVTNDGVYRSKMKNDDADYSVEKLKRPAKHKHGKIDVDAVLKKSAPVNDLKLRYSYLKNKHAKAALRTKDPHIDDDDTDSQGTNTNVNFKEAPNRDSHKDYNKLAHDIQLDFEQNIKTLSNENFQHHMDRPSDSRKKNNHPLKSERNFGENASREKELLRTTRTEGDKQFAHVESPDYKEYHELLANDESSS